VRTLSSGITQRLSVARGVAPQTHGVITRRTYAKAWTAVAAAEIPPLSVNRRFAWRNKLLCSSLPTHLGNRALAHRVAVIHQGKLAAFDTVSGLLARTKTANLEQAFSVDGFP